MAIKNKSMTTNIRIRLFIFFAGILYLFIPHNSYSQILISLLLGDKLNSPNLEFGLEGGLNRSFIRNIGETGGFNSLFLGFYFDFKLRKQLFLHTGVRVKANAGASDIAVYSLGNPDLDNIFVGGEVIRKLGYFYVPATLKYRFNNNIFVEAGLQLGLLYNAKDHFQKSIYSSNDLIFINDVLDNYNRLDAGIAVGLGYKIMENSGMSVGAFYYYGLINIKKESNLSAYNSILYFYVDIPIGAGKKNDVAD